LPVVVGQSLRHVVEPLGVEVFERPAGGGVQRLTAVDQQAIVGHVLGERVLEDVGRLVGRQALVEELEPPELQQIRFQDPRPIPDRGQKAQGELAPQHRGRLEHALGLLREPIDPRHEDPVDGVRDGQIPRWAGLLRHGPRELLEEERISFGLVEDELGHRVGEVPRWEDRVDHGQTVLTGEPVEGELRGVGLVHPRRPVAGSVCAHQKDRRTGEVLDQGDEVVLRRLVDPVEILDGEDQRLALAALEAEQAEDLDRPALMASGLSIASSSVLSARPKRRRR
jgi:hypothetical protein